MKFLNKTFLATAVVTSLVLPTAAFATNGMQAEGNGAKARGVGGAGVAVANETSSIVTNPAAVVGVGDRLDVAIGLFSPSPRTYEITGNTGGAFDAKQTSDNDLFFIPFFGMAFPIDAQSAWSFSLSAAGGMNTEYKTNFGENAGQAGKGKTGINLAQLFLTSSYGRKVNSNTTLGVSAIVAYQTFEATGLHSFDQAGVTESQGFVTNNGVDTSTGIGIKIGIQGDINPDLEYGISYQPQIGMSKLNKYKGLFADQGKLDIPATFAAGISYNMSPKTTLLFDYSYIDYAGVKSVGNKVSKFAPGVILFGSSDGPGFAWKSISIFKLGAEFKANSDWIYRAGWNHGENPVQDDEISVAFLAPGIITDHLTLGFTSKIDANSEYTVDFVHSFKNTQSGAFSSSFNGGTMTVEMEQNFLEIAYSKMF